jgi:hypothetical protein
VRARRAKAAPRRQKRRPLIELAEGESIVSDASDVDPDDEDDEDDGESDTSGLTDASRSQSQTSSFLTAPSQATSKGRARLAGVPEGGQQGADSPAMIDRLGTTLGRLES